MTSIVSLDEAREHLRVDDETPDMALIPLIAAAELAVADHMGRAELVGLTGWPSVDHVPATVVHAVKLVLADLFKNRVHPLAEMKAVSALVGRYTVIGFA